MLGERRSTGVSEAILATILSVQRCLLDKAKLDRPDLSPAEPDGVATGISPDWLEDFTNHAANHGRRIPHSS
jgi:hypothetical protein